MTAVVIPIRTRVGAIEVGSAGTTHNASKSWGGNCRRWGLGTDIRMRVMARTVMIRYHSRNGHLRSNCGRRWPSSQLRSRTGSRSSNHRCQCKYLHEDHDIYPVLVLDVPNTSSSFLHAGSIGFGSSAASELVIG